MGNGVCIRIEVLENGYSVELPDIDAIDKAEAAAKKKPGGGVTYMGGYTKEYAARTVDEVIALVKPALKNLPQVQYDEAFTDAEAEDAG
jgi:hypothetical protein